jgi:hypothetical protein
VGGLVAVLVMLGRHPAATGANETSPQDMELQGLVSLSLRLDHLLMPKSGIRY